MLSDDYRIQEFYWEKSISYHIASQRFYTVLFVNRGKCVFCRNKSSYSFGTEDIILIKPHINVSIVYDGGKYPLGIFCLQLTGCLLEKLSDEDTRLLDYFSQIPGDFHIIRSKAGITMLAKNLLGRLRSVQKEKTALAEGLFEKSILTMLIVLLLRALEDARLRRQPESRRHLLMDDLFLYIREHLTEDITLSRLEQEFYVDKSHICRQFKAQTGQTVHQYIIKSRLDLCRHYIEDGLPISEVCRLGGFGSYNHFFKVFKKEYGITPKEYFNGLKSP